ncbi:MAG TPA: hypothetical protein VGP89_00885 [Candidatus Angelobacter sp.]|jgi:hypothetical protein|nr:hypothetical protein [Candidatus Angelobacter sp.]
MKKRADQWLLPTLGAGSLIACWDFWVMFRAWFVLRQPDLIGGNIMFFFLGILPLVGMIGSFRRKLWGPKILIICPLAASTGFLFLSNVDWQTILFVGLLYLGPMAAIGIILFNLIQRIQIGDALRPETSN